MSADKSHSRQCVHCDGSGFIKFDDGEEDNCYCIDNQDDLCEECRLVTMWQ